MKMLISIRRKREDSWMKMTKKTNINIQMKKMRKTRFKNILQTGSARTNQNNYNFIIFQRKWGCFCTNTLLFLGGVIKETCRRDLEEYCHQGNIKH